jgi:hypothetical protein
MIRKRLDDDSGNWHIEVFVHGEWETVGQETSEDEADRILDVLSSWVIASVEP